MGDKRVTCTAPGVYLVHEPAQRPVEGVAVYHYERNRVWKCERCGVVSGTTRPNCQHIILAKRIGAKGPTFLGPMGLWEARRRQ